MAITTLHAQKIKLADSVLCVRCGERLPAGMYAYALTEGETFVGHRHYGRCPKKQQKIDGDVLTCSFGHDLRG